MSDLQVNKPFTLELYGEVHPPHADVTLELCALLYGGDTPAPFAFTSTSECERSMVSGVETRERCGEYASLHIDPAKLSTACTRLLIAVHVDELSIDQRYQGASRAINPTIKRLTYSVRALGFGNSAAFVDEDVIYGARLLTLIKKAEGEWNLDDSQRPEAFPELVDLAWEYGALELNPW
jgi:hypothetical protein